MVECLVGEIDEFGYIVVEDVFDVDLVVVYLVDICWLEWELLIVIVNFIIVVKGLVWFGYVLVDWVDYDWVCIDNLLLYGICYEVLLVYFKLLLVIEGVFGCDCLLLWCMMSN